MNYIFSYHLLIASFTVYSALRATMILFVHYLSFDMKMINKKPLELDGNFEIYILHDI